MTISQMLGQSGLLTLLGMGVVFAFLIILILCMHLLHSVLHALKLDKIENNSKSKSTAPVSQPAQTVSIPATNNDAIVAAIAAAVRHRNNK